MRAGELFCTALEVQALLAHAARMETNTIRGFTVLQLAATYSETTIAVALLRTGANVNAGSSATGIRVRIQVRCFETGDCQSREYSLH